jgi:gamma-glutamyltranspeptidase/glutathione hydrolase
MSARLYFLISRLLYSVIAMSVLIALVIVRPAIAQQTVKPVLHGKHWVAVTGKPLAATAGGMTFTRGGNAVDAACAMLASGDVDDVGHAGMGR